MNKIILLGSYIPNARYRGKIYSTKGIAPTMQAAAGMGGNLVPCVIIENDEYK